MTTIKLAMLTGKPHVGKSHITSELRNIGCEVLVSDGEIMKRIFDLLPQEREKELHKHIAPGSCWEHLYEYVDIDRLMRLHHRDWLARHGLPARVVAEGWIYAKERHRRQVYGAFDSKKFKDTSFQLCLVHYLPPRKIYVERHIKAVQERRPNDPILARPYEEQVAQAEKEYDDHIENIFEHPKPDEPVQFEELPNSDGILQYLKEFFDTG